MKRWLKRIGYTLLFLFILLNVLAAVQAYHATHYYDDISIRPKRHLSEMSLGEKINTVLFGVKVPKSVVVDSLHVPHNSISIVTTDGLRLSCWYASADVEYKRPSKGTVIMFHGHGGNKSGVIKEAEAFYNMGYNLLMVDFRAHGESEGNTCTIGYYESRDVKSAWDYVTAKREHNIILYGTSLGASTIIKAMYDYKEIQPSHIILEMPFGTLYDATKGLMRNNNIPEQPAALLLTFWGGIEHGFRAFDFKPQNEAKSIHCPVLLQKGANDIRVTEKEIQAIYHNVSSPGKTLIEYKDCGHQSLYKKDSVKWMQAVNNFLLK
ncbi:MAG TPA: alpha/beta fold hydrolase [Chitinophagaceae bacterium]|nr:alpha/beta fold hydrolase [Chitinophagaceae bacterium]